MDFKIGDLVIHKKYRDVSRRIFDIKDNKALIWGFYQYIDINNLFKVREKD